MSAIEPKVEVFILRVPERDFVPVKFIEQPIPAGFPSPGEAMFEEDIDLVAFLGMNKPSVYIARVTGDSMVNEHAPDRSYLIVDRSLRPIPGDQVLAVLNGEFTVKTLVASATGWMLYPANTLYQPIVIREGDEFFVWGVVAHNIIPRRQLKKFKFA